MELHRRRSYGTRWTVACERLELLAELDDLAITIFDHTSILIEGVSEDCTVYLAII